jgi:hypothetical protein
VYSARCLSFQVLERSYYNPFQAFVNFFLCLVVILRARKTGSNWDLVHKLIRENKLVQIEYLGKRFYMKKLSALMNTTMIAISQILIKKQTEQQ